MTAMQPLCHLMGIDSQKLSREENILLEFVLFTHLCEELKEIQKEKFKKYFRLMKFTTGMEHAMLEKNLLRFIIQDILSTEEYDLSGIAYYIDIPEDVIQELISGHNTNPSALLVRKSIELHKTVRVDLYREMMKKITQDYLAA